MNPLVFGILALLFVGKSVNGVKIEFFRNRNFTLLNYESNSTDKCNNVPADKKDVQIHSIKTDTCLMVYYHPFCKGLSRKFDLDNNLRWYMSVRSFHICNEDIGGPQLSIDITKYHDGGQYIIPDVLESYRDVCTCINVPQYVQNMTRWSINNFGNDYFAYYHPDCSENKWNAEHISAGLWCIGSRCVHSFQKIDSVTNTKYKIQSIGPDTNSKYFKTSCESKVIFLKDLLSFQKKQNKQFSSLEAKDKQREQQIETIFTENQSLKNKTVELELKLENLNKRYEDSLKKLKDDFEIFA